MLVGIDALPLAPPLTGIGHYTFELARALAEISPADQFRLISPFPQRHFINRGNESEMPANLRLTHMPRGPLRRRWWALGLPLHTLLSPLDIFHGTNYEIPVWGRCQTVVTIHDLSLMLHPDTHEAALVRRARRRLPVMARRATMVITATESAKREVCEHLNIRPERIAVTPFAPRRVFRPVRSEQTTEVRRRLRVDEEFLLYVGTIEPRKNLMTLVRAFDEVMRATTDLRPQLVIAGKEGWLTDELFSFIRQEGIGERVRFTGYVSEDDLCALYSACRVCIYPSLYEGFGLPPLEAMACGAPVITTRTSSIMEAVGDAARLFDPTDVPGLARSIIEIINDPDARRHLSIAGRRRAAEFSWEKTARATLDVYHEALKRVGR